MSGLPRDHGRVRPQLGAIFAAGAVVLVVVFDAMAGPRVILVSLLIVGPLSAALTTDGRSTRAIAALAILAAALSFLWNHSDGTWRYWVPLGVVAMASAFAVRMADYRIAMTRESMRVRLLADLGEIATGGHDPKSLATMVARLLVPRQADLCIIDMYRPDGSALRLAGAFTGLQAPLQDFLARRPAGPAACAPGQSPQTVHIPVLDDGVRRRVAHDAEHRRILERMNLTSAITVPLTAGDRAVGALIIATTPGRPRFSSRDEVEFVETLSGRLALALDNAVLSTELTHTKQEREAILEGIDAAITVRSIDGRMVYANPAAARLLRLPDPAAVMAFPPGELMVRFDVYSEEGDPVALRDLPGTRILGGELAPPPMIVRNVVKTTGEERWLLNKARPVLDPGGSVQLAVNVIEDITQTKRSEIAQRLLAEAARHLTRAPNPIDAMQTVAEAAVPGLADWAGVDLLGPRGRLDTVAIAHRDPEKVRLGWKLRRTWPADPTSPDGIGGVIASGEPQLMPDISDEMLVAGAVDAEHLRVLRAIGLNSTMIAPIRSGRRVIGALSFVSSTSRRFDERDLQLAVDLGRQIGLFIANAQLNAEQAHIASTLQASLVPDSIPEIPGWFVSTAYRAAGRANEVGGDFYDVVAFDGGWAAIIGDVVGKGAAAAALTAIARHTLAAIIKAGGDGGQALRVLNRRLRERALDHPPLTTVAILILHDDGRASILSAGHPLPLLRRGGKVTPVGTASPLLGYIDDLEPPVTELLVQPGDQFVLYTDGVLDATGARDRFGEERLLAAVDALAAEDPCRVAQLLVAQIDAFRTGEQNDDIAIITVSREAAAARLVA